MKKRLLPVMMILWVMPVMAATDVWVSVQQTVLRKQPSFLGPTVTRVSYQQAMTLLEEQTDWWKVEVNGKQGWVHHSAVSTSLVIKTETTSKSVGSGGFDGFNLGAAPDSAPQTAARDNDEITLAGKGFNQTTEDNYRKKVASLDFKSVDLMEKRSVNDFDVNRFAAAGDLQYLPPDQWVFSEKEDKGFFSSGSLPFKF